MSDAVSRHSRILMREEYSRCRRSHICLIAAYFFRLLANACYRRRSRHRVIAGIARPTIAASRSHRLSASISAAPVRARRGINTGVGRCATEAPVSCRAVASSERGFGLRTARVRMVRGFGLRIEAAIAGREARDECEASHQKQPAGAHHRSTVSTSCSRSDWCRLTARGHCFGAERNTRRQKCPSCKFTVQLDRSALRCCDQCEGEFQYHKRAGSRVRQRLEDVMRC
jgi:hypothetical protein